MDKDGEFTKKVWITLGAVIASAAVIFLLLRAADIFLLLFGGVLFSVFLRGAGEWIQHRTRLSKIWSIVTVIILLVLLSTALFQSFIPTISKQIQELSVTLPKSFEKVAEEIRRIPWLRDLINSIDVAQLTPDTGAILGKTAPFVTTVLGGLAGFLLMLITGLYMALGAESYFNGFIQLIPPRRRERTIETFLQIDLKLRWWLIGRILGMLIIGVMTTIGLSLLQIPLAFILGVIAGLLTFIPNFGPILSLVPAVAIAFAQSPVMALYVILLYGGIQFVETYFLTPWVQNRTVSLSPIMVIFSQILGGLLFGFPGFLLATPLVVVATVLIRYFYIEDVLGTPAKATAKGERQK